MLGMSSRYCGHNTNMRQESKMTTKWNNYCRNKPFYGICELKQTNSDKFYFHSFEPHQIDSLMAIEENGLVWKFSDQDQRLKPCDMISIGSNPAYVVIGFPTKIVAIRITDFVNFMNNTQNSYILMGEAQEIADQVVLI